MPQPADEKRLGELLVTSGKLSSQDLLAAVEAQRQQGGPQRKRLAEILVERGHISHMEFQQHWATANTPTTAPMPTPASEAGNESLPDEVRLALSDPSRRIDHYAVLSELGRGGMGVVYRCYDPQLNRTVAIKMILESEADAEGIARFQREALAVARIRHTGIVTLLGAGEHEGCPYLVMDFVAGETFNELLKREKVTARRIAEVVREVSLALDHAHAEGIIHRDVKPQNIMIDPQGRPLIMDFGLARDTSARQQLTMTGQIMGTPAYMAPEQADADMGPHGPWTDVYALGAVLYRALAGRPVFEAKGPAGMLMKVLLDEPVPLDRLDPAIPPDLVTITLRCLQKEPQRRYPSAAAVADELELFLDGLAIRSRPTRWFEKDPRGAQRNLGVSLSALAVMLVAVSAATAYMSDGHERARRDQGATLEVAEETNDDGPTGHTDPTRTSRSQAAASAEPASAEETEPISAMDWYERGRAQLAAGNTAEAIGDFTRAIKIDAQLASAWLARGKVHIINGNLRGAHVDFSHAIKINPNLAEAWLLRGETRATLGRPEGALEDFSRVIEIDPGNWEAWERRGRQRLRTGDQAGSNEDYERARSLSPKAQLRLGDRAYQAGNHAASIAYYTRAIEIDPDFHAAWNNRGHSRVGLGDLDGAIADFTRAIEINSSLSQLWFNRGKSRQMKGDLEGAIADLTRVIEINPQYTAAWLNLGKTRQSTGDLDGAIADYTRAIEIDPNKAECWSNRGSARYNKGEIDAAIEDCTRATQIDPNHGAAWFNLGGALLKEKDLDGAISAFSRAIEIHPGMARAWNNRADARRAKGDINGAIADWERLLEVAPNDPRGPTVRAEIQKLRAQQEKADSRSGK